jgi:hypothetical protein
MNKNMIIVIFLLFLLIIGVMIKVTKGFIPFPIGIRHLYHRIIAPDDLYQPIVTDNFLFHDKGFMKTYILYPKYLDIYDIGILFANKDISSKYEFRGKLLLEFMWRDKVLFKRIVDSIDSAWYVEGDMAKYKEVSLMSFEIPLLGRYKNDISIRISVLEPDQELKIYGNSIMLYIAVSATP